jgi:spore coat polysaccharide biosynthesis predicted glycosyltransferase SpsG
MRVAFRTEGNHRQGMGDVVGSLALATAFARRGDDVLLIVSGGEAMQAIRAHGYPLAIVESPGQELDPLCAFEPHVVIVNKLQNDPAYLRSVRLFGSFVVTIDDAGPAAREADIAINPLYHAPGALTDPGFVMLREEFRTAHAHGKAVREGVKTLLVLQGGSDTYGFTPSIVRGIAAARSRAQCTVVIGRGFRHDAELASAVADVDLAVDVVRNPPHISQLMAAADVAITAGGLSMFELCCVGTPSIVVCGELFEEETATRLEQAGAVRHLGFGGHLSGADLARAFDALAADPSRRRAMSDRGRELVDGRGCERIVELVVARCAAATGSHA